MQEGDAITPYYDPMIAKLIVWGDDRQQALARLDQALADYRVLGLTTNIAFCAGWRAIRPLPAPTWTPA